MPRTSAFTLIWLTEKACYKLFEREAPLPVNVEDESWFTWLSTHTSFAFQGRSGHLSLLKEERTRGEGGYWYAYRSQKGRTRKKYVGRSSDLTITRLEEIARGISQGRYVARQKSAKQVDMVSHTQIPLLLPKLRIPQTSSTLIRRERLLHKLDAVLECQIILLSAPAGFGKTTLVAQWIAHRNETLLLPTPAWISLDAGDNDPIRFWRYIITACSIWGKDLGKAALARLQAFQEPPFFPSPLETALTIFLNELPQEDVQQILVLEDYQVISSPRVHETLSFFIDHLPANVHCILISRGDPALPLIKWRARGQLNELHADELRFSEQETASFLQQVVNLPLSTKMLARLSHQLEGWAAGLRLVALTLQKQMSPEKLEQFLGNFSGSHRAILQYFVSEVLESQPESIRLFLLLTSLLDRLTGSLCDAITGRQDSGKILETLERAHLFLEPLDESGQWYRYHALFVEAMQYEARQRFSEEILLAAAATASKWYEQHNLLAEAIEMAFLAGETERCALLIEQISQDGAYTQHSSELYTLQRWLAQLPEEILQQHPLLCLNYVSALLFGTPAEPSSTPPSTLFEVLLSMAEQNLQMRPDPPLLGLTFALRSLVFWRQGMLNRALSSAEQALLWLTEEDYQGRCTCLSVIGRIELLRGQFEAARLKLLEARTLCEFTGNSTLTRAMTGILSGICLEQGKLHLGESYLQQMLRGAREKGDLDDIGHAQLGMALLLYERNKLVEAQQVALEALEAGKQLSQISHEANAMLMLARIEHALGQSDAARQRLQSLLARISSHSFPQIYADVLAYQARLQLDDGNFAAVQRWVETRLPHNEGLPLTQYQREELLVARLLIAQHQESSALDLLLNLQKATFIERNSLIALEVQIQIALAYQASHEADQARQQLHEALLLALPENFLRTFLDEGEAMDNLLRSVLIQAREKSLLAYLQKLLQASTRQSNWQEKREQMNPVLLNEPLSPQELRVLHLLADGHTNPEIARRLVVSVNTVRTQIQSIYRKLNVSNRVAASECARRLRLL